MDYPDLDESDLHPLIAPCPRCGGPRIEPFCGNCNYQPPKPVTERDRLTSALVEAAIAQALASDAICGVGFGAYSGEEHAAWFGAIAATQDAARALLALDAEPAPATKPGHCPACVAGQVLTAYGSGPCPACNGGSK